MTSPARHSAAPASGMKPLDVLRRAPDLAAIVVFAVAGAGIAVYLTEVHYQNVPLICSNSGLVDCASVLHSSYGVVPSTSLPITFPGLLWFVVNGALAIVALAALWRGVPEPKRLRQAMAVWGGVGLLSVLYLVYAEIVKLQHICAWCTGVHVLVLLSFLLALNRLQSPLAVVQSPPSRASTLTASAVAPKAGNPATPRSTTARPATSHPATTRATATTHHSSSRSKTATKKKR